MKRKQIAITVTEELKNNFYDTAKKLWTNPSNLITMFMSNVVYTKEIHFIAYEKDFKSEWFTQNELKELINEWKDSYDKISSLIDWSWK